MIPHLILLNNLLFPTAGPVSSSPAELPDAWSQMVYSEPFLIKSVCLLCDSRATRRLIRHWEWHRHLAVAGKHDLSFCWWINDVSLDTPNSQIKPERTNWHSREWDDEQTTVYIQNDDCKLLLTECICLKPAWTDIFYIQCLREKGSQANKLHHYFFKMCWFSQLCIAGHMKLLSHCSYVRKLIYRCGEFMTNCYFTFCRLLCE